MLLLVGCGPGAYTEDGAAVTFEALSSINDDLYATLWAQVSSELVPDDTGLVGETGSPPDTGTFTTDATGKALTWNETIGEGGDFTGTVDGPGSWTGVVHLDGGYTLLPIDGEEWGWIASIDARYEDVAYGPLTLDGPFTWLIQAAYESGAYRYLSRTDGTITAGGAAIGVGTVDATSRVTLAGGRYVVETVGTLGGWDVSRSYETTAIGL
jgi:hypothetical protein